MVGVWQRHPRYTVLVAVALITTFYLLVPSLASRIERSKVIYDKLLKDRQGLIKKFGPTPKTIDLFPPDVAPWPPYTVWDFFPAAFNCPHEVERLGALGDGGKWVCGLSRVAEKPDCIVYSFGMFATYSCSRSLTTYVEQIWGYDFSVKSFGPEIPRGRAHRTHFMAVGLAGRTRSAPATNPRCTPSRP
ncbi:hypothetical protein BDZ97DRAFT_1847750 [Flammula alnicola]|nr:hypothetical protein BDZ97DRAFT_1847750 [Flammula alnicola]